MRYYRIELDKRKKAEMFQLMKFWLESPSVDEFELKVATAGLKISAKDRFIFWTYKQKIEHPILYKFIFGFLIGTMILSGSILCAILGGAIILIVPWTLLCGIGWGMFFNELDKHHSQIDAEENGPRFYL